METITAVITIFVRCVADFCLTVVKRVVSRQISNPRSHAIIERCVACPHVCPPGLTAGFSHNMRRKHGTFGLHGHVGTVAVPSHVASKYLDHVITIIVESHTAVGTNVADRSQIEFEVTKALGKRNLFFIGEMLIRKDQQRVFEPRVVELGKRCIVNLRELQPGHSGAEAQIERCNLEAIPTGHWCSPRSQRFVRWSIIVAFVGVIDNP